MAEKIVMTAGKRFFKTELGEKQKVKGNPYKYQDSKGKWRNKDIEYFEKLGIPKVDAIVLCRTKNWARWLDGRQVGPFRLGPSTIIGFFPGFGDAIDGLLAVSTVTKARKVSDGLDDGIRTKMAINVAIEIVVGFTPVLGDLIDSLFKVNTRNATLLEEMLIDRVTKAKEKAEAEMMKAEKTGRASSRSRAHTDRYLDPEAASRTLQHAQTGSYYDSEPTPQRRDRAQVNGYHEPEPAPALPARGIDERHGGVHERLGRKADSPARAPKPSRSGGSWFNGRKNRKGDAVAQGTNRTRGREMPQVEDLGPARLPRPDTTRQQNVVHF